jgi:hypothetical protein
MLWLMQRTLIFLAVVLCAAQPSECDRGTYAAPSSLEPFNDSPSAEPARPSSPNAEIQARGISKAEPMRVADGLTAVP